MSLILWFNSVCYYIDIFKGSILWVIFHKLSWSIILRSNIFILWSICALISVRFIEIHSFTCWKTLIQHRKLTLRSLNDRSRILVFYPRITIRFMLRLVRLLKHELISVLIINGEDIVMKFINFITVLDTFIFILVKIVNILHVWFVSSIKTVIEVCFVGIIICGYGY